MQTNKQTKKPPNKTEKPTHKYKKYGETAKGEKGEKDTWPFLQPSHS